MLKKITAFTLGLICLAGFYSHSDPGYLRTAVQITCEYYDGTTIHAQYCITGTSLYCSEAPCPPYVL